MPPGVFVMEAGAFLIGSERKMQFHYHAKSGATQHTCFEMAWNTPEHAYTFRTASQPACGKPRIGLKIP